MVMYVDIVRPEIKSIFELPHGCTNIVISGAAMIIMICLLVFKPSSIRLFSNDFGCLHVDCELSCGLLFGIVLPILDRKRSFNDNHRKIYVLFCQDQPQSQLSWAELTLVLIPPPVCPPAYTPSAL
jgi:hypothetical protein